MVMRFIKIVSVMLGVALIAAGIAYAYLIYAPAPALPSLGGQAQTLTVTIGGRPRGYVQYVPANLGPGSPLIIALHGTRMDGALMRQWTGYEFDQWADKRGFVVLYPDGYDGSWNDCNTTVSTKAHDEQVDDVDFVRELVATSKAKFGIDASRVYLVGYSNGGQMAMTLATQAPSLAAGIAIFGATLPTPDHTSCPKDTATPPVMIVDGTNDPLTPYGGGEVSLFGLAHKGMVQSAPATAENFARRNGLTEAPLQQSLPHLHGSDPTSVRSLTWMRNGLPYVVFYTVEGGGHTVPNPAFRFPRIVGRSTEDIDAPAQAVAFFLK